MFQVLENDRPAEYPTTTVWRNSKFATFDEAHRYLSDWLGPYAPYGRLKLNEQYYYNRTDYMEIIEVA